jgi:hypothetical protein
MPEEDDHKKGHKFPFIVNELFSLDNGKINEKFFNDEIPDDESTEDKKYESEDGNSNPLDDSKNSEEERSSDGKVETSNEESGEE